MIDYLGQMFFYHYPQEMGSYACAYTLEKGVTAEVVTIEGYTDWTYTFPSSQEKVYPDTENEHQIVRNLTNCLGAWGWSVLAPLPPDSRSYTAMYQKGVMTFLTQRIKDHREILLSKERDQLAEVWSVVAPFWTQLEGAYDDMHSRQQMSVSLRVLQHLWEEMLRRSKSEKVKEHLNRSIILDRARYARLAT